jgi:hypothetical protein
MSLAKRTIPKLTVKSVPERKASGTAADAADPTKVTLNSNIESKHKSYKDKEPLWVKTRAFLSGINEVVQPYIRKLPGHDKNEYELFQKQSYFLPAVARTQEAFTGLIMNPEPVIVVPEEMKAFVKDVTNDGEPIQRMIARTVNEVVGVSRCGVLVDFPRIEATGVELSVAEAEDQGLRAYARFYRAEDILDWRTSVYGGQRYLSFVKLRETFIEKIDDWSHREVAQMRVLDFAKPTKVIAVKDDAGAEEDHADDGNEAGTTEEEVYRVRVYRQAAGGWVQIGDDFFPTANGDHLDEIPLVIFGPHSLDVSEVEKPILFDMVQISESHYNDSGLLQWALMWVGNPTAVFKGLVTKGEEPIRLGSSQGIQTSEEGGADILYLPAEGVGAIRQTMEDKRRDMAAVGARLLADETKGQIARDTAIIQRAGEHSVLAGIAGAVSDGWERVLRLLAVWNGTQVDEDEAEVDEKEGKAISVKLNTDYVPLGLQVGELKDLMAAVQNGTLTSRDMFGLLQKRGVIRADKSYEVHQEEVEEDDARIVDNPRTGIFAGNPDDPEGLGDPASESDQEEGSGAVPPKKAAAGKKPAPKKPVAKTKAK